MDRLEELKAKYQPVLNLISQRGVRLDHMHVEGGKLFVQGAAGSDAIKNEIWNAIKKVDATYGDLTCDLSIDHKLAPAAPASRTYTVVKGDSLWKIAQQFYKNGAEFTKIITANPDKLKDEKSIIHPGDVLVIPA
jgi:nucleoid-associated protein YgaU